MPSMQLHWSGLVFGTFEQQQEWNNGKKGQADDEEYPVIGQGGSLFAYHAVEHAHGCLVSLGCLHPLGDQGLLERVESHLKKGIVLADMGNETGLIKL